MRMVSLRTGGVALGACALALGAACSSTTPEQKAAQEMAQTLMDRQMILDQITRYYNNFGLEKKAPEASFYAEDGVLILGTRRYEGREAVQSAYGGGARRAGGGAGAAPATGASPAGGAQPGAGAAPRASAPAAGAAPAAPRERIPFNMTVDNALIVVHGDTASSQVIFTEYRPEKRGDPVRMTVQGREFATWVKVDGNWLYKERYIGSSEAPEGWKE